MTKQTDNHKKELAILEIKLNIQAVDKILTELQDNIIFSTLNIIHPSLLTHNEIQKYQIDANKIKFLRTGIARTNKDVLIFLVKIPYELFPVNKKLIIPLKNPNNCQMIKSPITSLLEYNNHYYEFSRNKALHQLNSLNHCIAYKNCEIIQNCKTETYVLDDSSIVVQLANKMTLTSNCDERNFELNGNYFIEFYNCTIKLNNITYFNNIQEIQNKYILPNIKYENNNVSIYFPTIESINTENLKTIKQLHYKEPLIYSGTILSILIILILITFYIYIKCRQKSTNFIIGKIQENFKDNERGVTSEFHSNKSNVEFHSNKSNILDNGHPHTKILF